jgi:hypothetical protein
MNLELHRKGRENNQRSTEKQRLQTHLSLPVAPSLSLLPSHEVNFERAAVNPPGTTHSAITATITRHTGKSLHSVSHQGDAVPAAAVELNGATVHHHADAAAANSITAFDSLRSVTTT